MDVDKLIKDNTGLIGFQMKRLGVLFDPEAESIGYEALWNATKTYDESKGYMFSTYASCCIYNALGSYLRSLNKKRKLVVISYNAIAYDEDNNLHEFLEFIPDPTETEKVFVRDELLHITSVVYLQMYNRLTNEKHKAIIQAWHEAEYRITNKEIASLVGVSQPYVNQVINTFKYNLKKKLEADFYD